MKAAVLTGIRQMEIREVPDPKIQRDNDVLLKIERVGVCGSDVHYYATGHIGSQIVQYPYRVGHECAATVLEIGAAVKNVKPGQKVAIDPAMACHKCDQCKLERENTCRNLRFLGCPGQADGCLCERMVLPSECLFPIDDKLTLDQAVCCEPLAIGVYAVQQAQMKPSSDAAILGAGPIGLSVMLAAHANFRTNCYITDKIPERLGVAQKANPVWTGNPDKSNIVSDILNTQPAGMDTVFECAGQQETIDQAIDLLKPGGTLMLIGIPREERISFKIDTMRRKEITVINVRRQNLCEQKTIDLVASGKINVDFMITHHFKLDQAVEAFEMVENYRNGVVKAIIEL